MFELLSILPLGFWIVMCLLIGGGIWSLQRMNDGIGLPMLAVLGTAAAWYVGDAFYNDYADYYMKVFSAATLENAWWQMAWFLTAFLVATPLLHHIPFPLPVVMSLRTPGLTPPLRQLLTRSRLIKVAARATSLINRLGLAAEAFTVRGH